MKEIIDSQIVEKSKHEQDNNLTFIVISENCEKIQDRAFANCKELISVKIENADTELLIEFSAFKGCNGLVSFEIDKRKVRFYKNFKIRGGIPL